MRVLWFRATLFLASVMLALIMLAINFAFEAAGCVPDVEACDFLAGGLVLSLILYPLVAGVVAARAVRPLARRFPDAEDEIARYGGWIGFGGASLYLETGVLIVALRPPAGLFPPLIWGLLALYTLLAALGGRLGALLTIEQMRPLPLREGGG